MYITLGAIETGDGEKLVTDIKSHTAGLRKPFSCISDISHFSIVDPEESVWADKALKALSDAGMTRAVRVIGEDVPYSETKEKYGNALNLAKTLDGAEEILDAQDQGN